MRIFKDCLEAVKEVERDLAEMGIRYESDSVQDKMLSGEERQTLELAPYAYAVFSSPEGELNHRTFMGLHSMLRYKKDDPDFIEWVYAEANERETGECSKKNPGDAWRIYAKFWQQFLRDSKFAYTYVERIHEQLDYIVSELKARPNTRQAIITIYDRHQDLMNMGGRDRVPCSISYQFILRDGRLTLIYSQRSCDFKKFFQADMYFAISLLNHVAQKVGAEPFAFYHFINSLHMFKADAEGVF